MEEPQAIAAPQNSPGSFLFLRGDETVFSPREGGQFVTSLPLIHSTHSQGLYFMSHLNLPFGRASLLENKQSMMENVLSLGSLLIGLVTGFICSFNGIFCELLAVRGVQTTG